MPSRQPPSLLLPPPPALAAARREPVPTSGWISFECRWISLTAATAVAASGRGIVCESWSSCVRGARRGAVDAGAGVGGLFGRWVARCGCFLWREDAPFVQHALRLCPNAGPGRHHLNRVSVVAFGRALRHRALTAPSSAPLQRKLACVVARPPMNITRDDKQPNVDVVRLPQGHLMSSYCRDAFIHPRQPRSEIRIHRTLSASRAVGWSFKHSGSPTERRHKAPCRISWQGFYKELRRYLSHYSSTRRLLQMTAG